DRAKSFSHLAAGIALDEGFRVNFHKLKFMGTAQRQRLAGIVVNAHANSPRRDFELLEATLYNCARRGPTAENRAAHPRFRDHLLGRIAWVASLNPRRGERLKSLFDAIRWGTVQ